MLLGSSEWYDDEERWNSILKSQHLSCYDAHDFTFGSFTVLYNKAGAKLLLQEQSRMAEYSLRPFLIPKCLARRSSCCGLPQSGYCRSGRHKSTVDPQRVEIDEMRARIRRNGWNISLYEL